MLHNKIYQNYILEIIKTFFTIVIGLSLIALTVRAVNFLDLIVDSGYPLSTYFLFSFLNIFGIAPKFIPLSFLVALVIFILQHKDDSEFIILWTSGVKKMQIVNLIFFASIVVILLYLILSAIITPFTLNKSRNLLNQDKFNSFLPTIRSQQFSDSFKGFTFIVDKKIGNEIENIFLHDTGKNLNKFSSNTSNVTSTTITAKKGIVKNRNLFLIDGQIISSKINNIEVIDFDELNVSLNNLSSATIKKPKLQETSTLKLLSCFFEKNLKLEICKKETRKEILPNLIRRLILPFYTPCLALLCCFLLVKNKINLRDKLLIYTSSFTLLIFTELVIRYTGIYSLLRLSYILLPFVIILILYLILIKLSSKNIKSHE